MLLKKKLCLFLTGPVLTRTIDSECDPNVIGNPESFKCHYREAALDALREAGRSVRPTTTTTTTETPGTFVPTESTTTSTTTKQSTFRPTTRLFNRTTMRTTRSTTTSIPPMIAGKDRFCEYRVDGKFGFPLFCEVFVTCDRFMDSSPRAVYQACPMNQNFDSINKNCVDENTFNCFLPPDLVGR